jgi:hypothetical protein
VIQARGQKMQLNSEQNEQANRTSKSQSTFGRAPPGCKAGSTTVSVKSARFQQAHAVTLPSPDGGTLASLVSPVGNFMLDKLL